jgi:hypothetical protein
VLVIAGSVGGRNVVPGGAVELDIERSSDEKAD